MVAIIVEEVDQKGPVQRSPTVVPIYTLIGINTFLDKFQTYDKSTNETVPHTGKEILHTVLVAYVQ